MRRCLVEEDVVALNIVGIITTFWLHIISVTYLSQLWYMAIITGSAFTFLVTDLVYIITKAVKRLWGRR